MTTPRKTVVEGKTIVLGIRRVRFDLSTGMRPDVNLDGALAAATPATTSFVTDESRVGRKPERWTVHTSHLRGKTLPTLGSSTASTNLPHGRVSTIRAKRRVLVVEDNHDLRTLLADYLGAAGFVVDVAADGQPALACMYAALPDVVLLDLSLPVVDGRSLVALCRQDPQLATVPIVLLSGSWDLHAAVKETGARIGLAKPLDLDVLLSVVECVASS